MWFHHSVFYAVSRAAPLFVITCHCVISNSSRSWLRCTPRSPVATAPLATATAFSLLCFSRSFFCFFFFFSLFQSASIVRTRPPPDGADGCSSRLGHVFDSSSHSGRRAALRPAINQQRLQSDERAAVLCDNWLVSRRRGAAPSCMYSVEWDWGGGGGGGVMIKCGAGKG